jgi:hypothetical protein
MWLAGVVLADSQILGKQPWHSKFVGIDQIKFTYKAMVADSQAHGPCPNEPFDMEVSIMHDLTSI